MEDTFVLKIMHPKGECSWILGKTYNKIHLDSLNKDIPDNCATRAILHECSNMGEYYNTLDFIVDEDDNVFELSKNMWGFKNISCFYITVNGNTIEKIIPKEYDRETLKYVWKKYGATDDELESFLNDF